MTDKELVTMVGRLKRAEAKSRAAKREAEETRERIKAEFEERGVEEVHAGRYIVRVQEVRASRFNVKLFAEQQPTAYQAYSTNSVSRRVTVVG